MQEEKKICNFVIGENHYRIVLYMDLEYSGI